MRNTVIGMSLACLVLGILAFVQGGWERLGHALLLGAGTALKVSPLLVVAFAMAGLITVVLSQESIQRWLGRGSCLKGLLLAAGAGALVPGGPYVYFPLAASLLCAGAEVGTAIAFVTAKNLWTLSRLPMEMALLSPRLTILRYVVTFVFPILLGLAANMFFSQYTERIRQGIWALQGSETDSIRKDR